MRSCKLAKTPLSTTYKLDKDQGGNAIYEKMYICMIGSLLYLIVSKLDITLRVCLCARSQSAPKKSYLSAANRVLIYFSRTLTLGLWYPKGDDFELARYSEASCIGYKVEMKRTSGTFHCVGQLLVFWHSEK